MLRHLVSYERLVDTSELDDDGNVVQQWEPVPTAQSVPCEIRDIAGSEQERGRSIEAIATHRIRHRYVSGLTPDMRIRRNVDNKLFEINRIGDPVGIYREQTVIAKQSDGDK